MVRLIDDIGLPPVCLPPMAQGSRPTIDLADLLLHMSGHGARSPIVQWMVENHDEFAAALAATGVRWEKVAAYLADHGLRTVRGDIPTGETTRRCWTRARRLVARRRTRLRRAAPASVPAGRPGKPEGDPSPALPGDPAPVAAPAGARAGAVAGAPKPRFEFARLRNNGRGVSAAERRALGDPTAPADPNDPR